MNKWKVATLILAIGVVLLTVSLVSMYGRYQSIQSYDDPKFFSLWYGWVNDMRLNNELLERAMNGSIEDRVTVGKKLEWGSTIAYQRLDELKVSPQLQPIVDELKEAVLDDGMVGHSLIQGDTDNVKFYLARERSRYVYMAYLLKY